jgi:hypothetical protein
MLGLLRFPELQQAGAWRVVMYSIFTIWPMSYSPTICDNAALNTALFFFLLREYLQL